MWITVPCGSPPPEMWISLPSDLWWTLTTVFDFGAVESHANPEGGFPSASVSQLFITYSSSWSFQGAGGAWEEVHLSRWASIQQRRVAPGPAASTWLLGPRLGPQPAWAKWFSVIESQWFRMIRPTPTGILVVDKKATFLQPLSWAWRLKAGGLSSWALSHSSLASGGYH